MQLIYTGKISAAYLDAILKLPFPLASAKIIGQIQNLDIKNYILKTE